MDPIDLITNMVETLQYVPQRYLELTNNLSIVQGKITDLEHDIENKKFDIQKGYKFAKQLQDLRKERRQIKNEIDLLEQLNQYIKNNKKLEIDLFKIKTTMLKIKDRQDNWIYTPRVPEEQVKEEEKC